MAETKDKDAKLKEFNQKMKQRYFAALFPALAALILCVAMFSDYQTGKGNSDLHIVALAALVLFARFICAPVKKVLLGTGLPILIFSPLVLAWHLIWTAWVLLSPRPYSEDPTVPAVSSDSGYVSRKVFIGTVEDGKIEGEWVWK